MPINFFDNPAMMSTDNVNFGLCDDVAPIDVPRNPAYIDEENPDNWTADVKNTTGKTAAFYPIDNCIEVLRENGEMDNRCDGMLCVNENLLFVELKDRNTGHWVADGMLQLRVTIRNFEMAHDISQYKKVKAYICNKQRPRTVVSSKIDCQKFKDETGYDLCVDRNIKVE